MAEIGRGVQVTGASRAKLAAEVKKQYTKGSSIRELAEAYGRSYGFVHKLLSESGVVLRGRGGAGRTGQRAAARKK